jgi:glycosyltransferase involved in cell wall biosynthesis
MRIALVAPPLLALPPTGYAGTERIVAALAIALHERGHSVTVFASGDSQLPCEVVPVVPRALWPLGLRGDMTRYLDLSAARVWQEQGRFDIVHSHLDTAGFAMARHGTTPVLTTLHSRLDVGGAVELIDVYPDIPLVAISDSQRRWNPDADWIATVPHGLDFADTPRSISPGDYLLLVGRLTREKGVVEAIALARRAGFRLVMAAKAREPEELAMFAESVRPAVDDGIVDWRGEVSGAERDRLMAGALATLMLGAWPEPFGLVAVESMATRTPVKARRAGAYPEVIEHGVTGFLVDDEEEAMLALRRVGGLDRRLISARSRERFSVGRMARDYEEAFRAVLERGRRQVETTCDHGSRARRERRHRNDVRWPNREARQADPAHDNGVGRRSTPDRHGSETEGKSAAIRWGASSRADQPESNGASPMSPRQRIRTEGQARYVRRDDRGRFTSDQTDVGRSAAADQRRHSAIVPKRGEGDRVDRPGPSDGEGGSSRR